MCVYGDVYSVCAFRLRVCIRVCIYVYTKTKRTHAHIHGTASVDRLGEGAGGRKGGHESEPLKEITSDH